MAKTYVSLVSEQAIPNVQYIKEFKSEISTFLFISTAEMEKHTRTQSIADACELKPNTYLMEIVDEKDFTSIQEGIKKGLGNAIFKETDGYIVNCTLGTKVMSIALFDFFKDKPKASLYYTFIGENAYRSILDNTVNEPFKSKISVVEYVTSYGIKIKSLGKQLFGDLEYSQNFLEQFLKLNKEDFDILEHLRNDEEQKYRNKGIKSFSEINGLSEFLSKVHFPMKSQDELTKYEVKYLTGGWLEEWVFYKFKQYFTFEKDEIVMGLNSYLDAENDLDVVFMLNNDIHIIECKTLIPDTQLEQSTLYKSGALVEKFGRNARSYLFTLSDLRKDGEIKKSVKDRATQQKIKVADRLTLVDGLSDFIDKEIKKQQK